MADKESVKLISQNKKAYHDYFIEETYECGISLAGTEVKSIRAGQVNLKDSFASVQSGEVMLIGMHISPYEKGNIFNKDPLRERKLLMHKAEIRRLIGKVKEDGYSLIPTKVYLKGSKVKVELALAKGKKLYDKRASIADKEAKRRIDRKIKEYNQ
jgi:SsrA-binding protein